MQAAAAIGVEGYLVATGYGATARLAVRKSLPEAEIRFVTDIQGAAEQILAGVGTTPQTN
eukprot:3356171-Prorocentrum_lima.AAC.1